MTMEPIIAKLLGFMMILTRVAAFFMVAPVFSWNVIPVRVKAAMAVLLAIFFSMITDLTLAAKDLNTLRVVLLIANEALYGVLMGLIAMVLFMVIRISGRIIERQMGLAMAQVLDPFTKERAQPLGMILEVIFILLFFSVNGHHIFLRVLAGSYEAFPLGTVPSASIMAAGMAQAGSAMLLAALRLAGPVLAAFILLMVVLAILARVVPEMNILFISLPLRVGLGLIMVACFLPLTNSYISEFAELMNNLLPI